ncbi:pseudouridine synthase [Ligilactobacillus hayakitensis DSM 18933 = JCM 14209]|uniref:Pseudouridine synthase n=2 Tax=Ligilactobacillus TaxID=2767887 RepID=A0A0R1WVZ2_9LACO|nr:pseudouridine synthase [Ligilactobacillus hayakitensis DSM 18933 = JCM 14209]
MGMIIKFEVKTTTPMKLKTFLRNKKVSRRLLAKIRYGGGEILVNQHSGRTIDKVNDGDIVSLQLPNEEFKQPIEASYVPIKILYEDDNFLVVDKPPFVASIPSPLHRTDSMLNRVVGYYALQQNKDIIPHVVSRLDRDTSGAMLFAKHRYAHALLDQQLQNHLIKKYYTAILTNRLNESHFSVNLPIDRKPGSLIKRAVLMDGKYSKTEYWVEKQIGDMAICKIRLHTGRTHQIRVHSAYIGHPLVSDTLYGGKIKMPLQRQALHCSEINFWDDFKERLISVRSELPNTFNKLIQKGGK